MILQAPGPGAYNSTDPSVYKDRAPLYSMTGRNLMSGDVTQKPGPGAHKPDAVSHKLLVFVNCNVNCKEKKIRFY